VKIRWFQLPTREREQGDGAGTHGIATASERSLFVLAHKGRPLTPDALEELRPLNHLLERDEAFGTITPGAENASAFEWRFRRRWRTPGPLLLPIARAMAELGCPVDFSREKACEGPICTLLFLDTTQGHAR
jgi:predicted RNA-binding Zn ribbon-like protein